MIPFACSLDPITRDLEWDATRNAWVPTDPDAQALIAVLLTPKGTHVPDTSFGLDYSVLQKRGSNAEAEVTREVERAIARVALQRGLSVSVGVTVEGNGVDIRIAFTTRSGRTGEGRVTL